MTRFEMTANYVDVLKPRTPNENTILSFRSGHGVYADISLSSEKLASLKKKLENLEAERL